MVLAGGLLALQACSSPGVPSAEESPGAVAGDVLPSVTATIDVFDIDELMQSCPSSAEVAYINSRTQLVFRADPTSPGLVCLAADGSEDLTLLKKNVYNILRVMQALTFDQPLPWTDLNLFD